MKTKITALLLTLFSTGSFVQAQNLVNNPGFETYLYNSSCGLGYYICQAPSWVILNNTPDVIYPDPNNSEGNSASHAPRTGNGNARFASPPNGMDEYFYGSTSPLTAGQTYVVSFWVRKDYATEQSIPMGMHIGSSVPSAQLLNPYVQTLVPQIVVNATTTQYVKGSMCFTPTSSGIHYLTFGAFGGNGTGEGQVWLLDDVSVTPLQPGQGTQVADITLPQTSYCAGDVIVADGSASTDETEYMWSINRVLPNGSETNVYTGQLEQGQAGNLLVSDILHDLGMESPGACYRIYLKVLNGCSDETYIDFCYENPFTQFITNGNPVCENTPVDLQVTGDDGWTYTWSTGQSGVGTKSITVMPTAPTSQYTVTVTTPAPASCSYTQTLDLTVSSLAGQVPPTMDGINGWGEYTYYVNAGSAVDFTSTISNNAGETVDGSFNNNNLPNGYSYIIPPNGTNGGTFSFHWQTQLNTTGDYSFSLYLKDNNGCLEMDNTYTFNIKVICEYCPICISYDDRTPTNNPVPADTKAGRCINVGLNSVVEIGTGNSAHLQAGESIEMGAFFDSNGGVYEAVIDTTTCLEACQSCCDNFSGFTVDTPFPNIFSPNGDGANDIWYVRDDDHQYCAFGATGFELYIQNKQDLTVYELVSYPGQGCCPFQALITNPSSIYWNGKYNVGPFKGQPVPDGVYYYVLYLHGCGQTGTYSGNISIYVNSSGMMQNDGSGTQSQTNTGLVVNDTGASRDSIRTSGSGLPEDHFYVFPNPTKNIIRLHSEKTIKQVQIFDANGKQVLILNSDFEQPIDLSSLGSGSYRVIAMFNDNSSKEQIIVKE